MNTGSLVTGNTTNYHSNWLFSGPWQGLYSGYYYTGLYNQSSYGYYWSSTVGSGTYARYLYFNSSYVYPGSNGTYEYRGFAVRCLAP
jgi:uncharacterized protein (TIGR02145 family)